ncbi:fatty acid synthase alpha subunit Lsd1 [Entomophthora muscae]|uniref:Fatty acid synthase alpha subunit Lsd1 n=1 Tax=Entomophthora muscae TaxID=34485 RepID=A0ACC2U3G1_9FUNG|nr:fatty acid synthase alpha subunit Lsd1 [Entomophthora muscae]
MSVLSISVGPFKAREECTIVPHIKSTSFYANHSRFYTQGEKSSQKPMNQVVINQNGAFIAKASGDKSLIKNSKKALGSLFWIGTLDQQTYPLVTLNSAICKYSISNGKRNPSGILAIYNLKLGEFKQLLRSSTIIFPRSITSSLNCSMILTSVLV